jgi:general secretion pathway protein A
VYAVRERRGFGLLTGEVGTGKTTVVRRALEELEPAVRCLHFYHTMLGFDDVVRVICEEFRVPGGEGPLVTRLSRLNDWLIDELEAGRIVALLVDEAQNLGDDTLEQLRLLSNLETERAKLLQIVLIGQPELEVKLARPHLRQLRQRVAIQCRLGPLAGVDEVQRFIDYRLAQVGYAGRPLFNADAVAVVAAASRGVPRLVNILGDNALLMAFAAGLRRVTGRIAREAAIDLRLMSPPPRRSPAPTPVAAASRQNLFWRDVALGLGLGFAGVAAASLALVAAPAEVVGRLNAAADAARARVADLLTPPPGAPSSAAAAPPAPGPDAASAAPRAVVAPPDRPTVGR